MTSIYKDYLFDLGFELKNRAYTAFQEKDAAPEETKNRIFQEGRLMAFNEIISIMQQQAQGFGIPLQDLRLDDIDPDRDLT